MSTSKIIPLPPKIAKAKPPVKRSELIVVMAKRLIEQEKIKCNKSADALEEEQQSIEAELKKLVKEKPRMTVLWHVSKNWQGESYRVDHCYASYMNESLKPSEALQNRMFDHEKKLRVHDATFGWLGLASGRPSEYSDMDKVLRRAKDKAKALLDNSQVRPSSAEDRVAQMLADPDFVEATDAYLKRLVSAQPKQLTA